MLKRLLTAGAMACLYSTAAMATPGAFPITVPASCSGGGLSSAAFSTFKAALVSAVQASDNLGLGFNMWATLVAKDGTVCAVAFSGSSLTDQWLASRVISAQKAFTANGLSLGTTSASGGSGLLPTGKLALSTAVLYSAVQPGGSLYGLQHSNPVAAANAYGDRFGEDESSNTANYGTRADPMVGQVIGGINVFGGGLALYDSTKRVGGVGVSGDQSCTDHMVSWHLRHNLNLDFLLTAGISGPAKIFAGDTTHPDNIIFDIGTAMPSGFGHPTCLNNPTINPTTHTPTSLPIVQ